MKTRLIALLLACVASGHVVAQTEPAEVTDTEIGKYKTLAEASCREAGVKQADPQDKIDSFCGCLVTTLNKSLTRAEWQQAYFYSMNGRSKDEMQVLAPHLKKVAECRPASPPPAATTAPATPAAPAASQLQLKPPSSSSPRQFNAK